MHYTKMLKYQAAKIPKLFHVLKNYYDFAKIREERPTRKGKILPERVYDCFLLNQRVCKFKLHCFHKFESQAVNLLYADEE